MSRRRAGVLAAIALVGLSSCGDANPSPPTPADLEGLDLSPDHTITVDEAGFEPRTLRMVAGEVVRLVNEGDEPHSFTDEDQRFDTGRMEPGDDVTLVLTEPGESTYFDVTNPDHTARLTVTEAADDGQ